MCVLNQITKALAGHENIMLRFLLCLKQAGPICDTFLADVQPTRSCLSHAVHGVLRCSSFDDIENSPMLGTTDTCAIIPPNTQVLQVFIASIHHVPDIMQHDACQNPMTQLLLITVVP